MRRTQTPPWKPPHLARLSSPSPASTKPNTKLFSICTTSSSCALKPLLKSRPRAVLQHFGQTPEEYCQCFQSLQLTE
ncbi:hypothetical protein PGIGA_G00119270, partial [Pangasianodon gigas]|nr:hypothetical protein [Pangasianodon gigas]